MDPGFLAKLERDRVEASNRLADRRKATATPAPTQPLVSRTTTESSTIGANKQQDKGEIETKVIGGSSDSGDGTGLVPDTWTTRDYYVVRDGTLLVSTFVVDGDEA